MQLKVFVERPERPSIDAFYVAAPDEASFKVMVNVFITLYGRSHTWVMYSSSGVFILEIEELVEFTNLIKSFDVEVVEVAYNDNKFTFENALENIGYKNYTGEYMDNLL